MAGTRTALIAAAVAVGLLATEASANTYTLVEDHCTDGCSTGVSPFGTVQVVQNGANLDFTVTLNGPYTFNKSNGLDAFVFGVSGGAGSDITSLSAGFEVDKSSPVKEDGFGTFLFGITKALTGGSSLTFTFLNAVLADLVVSTGSGSSYVLFAADIVGLSGHTGPVGGSTCTDCGGAGPGPSPTPIPAALPLFASGLAGLGLLRWRRKRAALAG